MPLISSNDSIPSLMNMSVKPAKPAILPTPGSTLIRSDLRTFSPPSSPPDLKFRDVDERVPLLPTPSAHLPPKIIKREMDIDERPSIPLLPLPTPPAPQPAADSSSASYEALKKELIIKVMKAIADEDETIFSQIPKQTLTELLVKLLHTNSSADENRLSTNSIETLLSTLTPKLVQQQAPKLNESSSSDLHIDLGSVKTRKRKHQLNAGAVYDSDYSEDDYEIRKINIKHEDENDDDMTRYIITKYTILRMILNHAWPSYFIISFFFTLTHTT